MHKANCYGSKLQITDSWSEHRALSILRANERTVGTGPQELTHERCFCVEIGGLYLRQVPKSIVTQHRMIFVALMLEFVLRDDARDTKQNLDCSLSNMKSENRWHKCHSQWINACAKHTATTKSVGLVVYGVLRILFKYQN